MWGDGPDAASVVLGADLVSAPPSCAPRSAVLAPRGLTLPRSVRVPRPSRLQGNHVASLITRMLLLVATGTSAAPVAAPSTSTFAIEHVIVIDVETGTRLRDHTVIVSGHRIA